MTRMLALVSDAFGSGGGIAQYNRDFLEAAVSISAITGIEILPRHASKKFSLPAKLLQAAPGENRIAYILRALIMGITCKAGIVFCGHINLAPLAAAVARLSGARLVLQLHGIEAWQRPSQNVRRAVEAADLVLCVSRYTRAKLLSWAAMEPEQVVVLPNTVGDVFSPGDAASLRATWGLEGKKILLTVARMSAAERYKGHERVIAEMPALGSEFVYVVLGSGDDMERVKDVARKHGVADRVLFKGEVGRDVLIDAYRLADFYVMPSTGEGFGIAFLEAMASGTPALGLAMAGACDALADGELGIAATDENFGPELARLSRQNTQNGAVLADAVRRRFGRDMFVRNVQSVLNKLLAA